MSRALRHARIDQEGAVGTNRNFGSVRKRDGPPAVALALIGSEAHPKEGGLESKGWHHLAATLKQQRDVEIARVLFRHVHETEGRDNSHIFVGLALDPGN